MVDMQKPPSFTAFSFDVEGALALIAQIDSMLYLCRNRFSFLSCDRRIPPRFNRLARAGASIRPVTDSNRQNERH